MTKLIKKVMRKIRNRGEISHKTFDYFSVNNPNLGRPFSLPMIHKRVLDMPGRPVISNSGFYTEYVSSFIEYHAHLPKKLSRTLKIRMIFYVS